jgi:hypothetical protein
MKYQWTFDTPWADKGDGYDDTLQPLMHQIGSCTFTLDTLWYVTNGWIKPVEEKGKLTAEEILEKITSKKYVGLMLPQQDELDMVKLAAFLAEHLK